MYKTLKVDRLTSKEWLIRVSMKLHQSKLQLNEEKMRKELRISFAKNEPDDFAPVIINEKAIETVRNILFQLSIVNNLKWNCRVAEIMLDY